MRKNKRERKENSRGIRILKKKITKKRDIEGRREEIKKNEEKERNRGGKRDKKSKERGGEGDRQQNKAKEQKEPLQ